jgi:hypothetical protein
MKFTSIPKSGSSWNNSLPFSFDTEGDEPQDLTIEILSNKDTIAQRKLYGVVAGTIDIAPYLKHFSWIPPTITQSPSIETSPSAQHIRVVIDGVSSSAVKLFHSPFDLYTSQLLGSTSSRRAILRGSPILLTILATNTIQLNIKYITATLTTTTTHSVKSMGMPMDVVVPTASLDDSVVAIALELISGTTVLAQVRYNILEPSATSKQLMWYNSSGGIETYPFMQSIRTSYCAKVVGEGSANTTLPAELSEASVHYRLCSAHESPEEIERLSQMVFSPRIFLMSGETITPVTLDTREVIFDSHGTLRQLCVEITEPWKGGVR